MYIRVYIVKQAGSVSLSEIGSVLQIVLRSVLERFLRAYLEAYKEVYCAVLLNAA